VDKVTNRLPTWEAGLLNRAGRTVLIKSALSVIPTHTAFVLNLSPWVISCINSFTRVSFGEEHSQQRGDIVCWLGREFVARSILEGWESLTCSDLGMPCV